MTPVRMNPGYSITERTIARNQEIWVPDDFLIIYLYDTGKLNHLQSALALGPVK